MIIFALLTAVTRERVILVNYVTIVELHYYYYYYFIIIIIIIIIITGMILRQLPWLQGYTHLNSPLTEREFDVQRVSYCIYHSNILRRRGEIIPYAMTSNVVSTMSCQILKDS